jgi:hypothetical protein
MNDVTFRSAQGKWYLYCENTFIHGTDDPAEVQSWLEADPEKHEARDTRT